MAGELVWMKDAFKKHGLEVKGVKGWKKRGHPFTFSPVGVMFHHTASARERGPVAALGTVTQGRPDLSGPLCNILIGRDSTVNLIAAGYAFHAGTGGPYKSVPADSGNRYFIGIEVENDGVGEPWSDDLLATVAEVSAICLAHTGKGAEWCIGHKTWTSRKIDPANIEMENFQKRVRAKMQK